MSDFGSPPRSWRAVWCPEVCVSPCLPMCGGNGLPLWNVRRGKCPVDDRKWILFHELLINQGPFIFKMGMTLALLNFKMCAHKWENTGETILCNSCKARMWFCRFWKFYILMISEDKNEGLSKKKKKLSECFSDFKTLVWCRFLSLSLVDLGGKDWIIFENKWCRKEKQEQYSGLNNWGIKVLLLIMVHWQTSYLILWKVKLKAVAFTVY